MADGRSLHLLVDAAELESSDDVLRVVSTALRRDRAAMRKLADDARGRLGSLTTKRVDKALNKALGQLRDDNQPTKRARTRVKTGADPIAIRGAKLAQARSLQAVLRLRAPAGRQVRMGPTTREELVSLASAIDASIRRSDAAIRHNARSIDALALRQRKLAATQREMATLIAELQSRGELALLQGLLSSIGKLDVSVGRCRRKIEASSRSTRSTRSLVDREVGALRTELSSLASAARVQRVTDAATAMQTAAFGAKGNLLDPKNLVLAGNHVLWSLAADILKALGLAAPKATDPIRWLAPLASLVTSQIAVGRAQHERFVSGVAENFLVPGFTTGIATISLQRYIAPGYWPAFKQRTDVVVTATSIDTPDESTLSGQVVDGVLTITVQIGAGGGSGGPAEFVGTRVAWVVDTGQG